jgi:N-acyl homoserine lactone hydrolase
MNMRNERNVSRRFAAGKALRTLLTAVALIAAPLQAAGAGQVDHLYVIDCGWAHSPDQSRWSPGVNVGVPIDVSDNCYLLHHSTGGYLLWDTGITDRLAALQEGETNPTTKITWHRAKTLMGTLADLGVKPAQLRYVAISHFHPDHSGNVDLFPDATLIIQKAELDHVKTLPQKPFNPEHMAMELDGDKDLFGDGTVMILSTPGHTPGHQSLLVHLEKTGYVVLSGDAVHFQSNWDNRRIPGFNFDQKQSAASMEKIAHVLADRHAQLWINHDKPSTDGRRHAPEFYE